MSHTHLSHTTLSHTPSFTRNFVIIHTIFHANFVTHLLSRTTLSHTHTTLSHILFHTQLCHTSSFTHNFVTHHLSHTTLSRTIFHTQLCHTPSFTHNFVTHHLSHTHTHLLSHATWHLATSTFTLRGGVAGVALGDIDLHFAWQAWHLAKSTFALRGRHGTWRHPSSLCVAGAALGDIHLHFAWPARHLATLTCVLLGNGGTCGTELALVHPWARLVARAPPHFAWPAAMAVAMPLAFGVGTHRAYAKYSSTLPRCSHCSGSSRGSFSMASSCTSWKMKSPFKKTILGYQLGYGILCFGITFLEQLLQGAGPRMCISEFKNHDLTLTPQHTLKKTRSGNHFIETSNGFDVFFCNFWVSWVTVAAVAAARFGL